MKRLPDQTIPALRKAIEQDGTLTDMAFIRNPGIGRVTLARIIELGWIELIGRDTDFPRRYKLTDAGREQIATPK